MSAENVAELSRLVKSLAEKIDKLEASSQSRHDTILTKLTTLETTTSELSAGLEGMNQEMEAVKQTLQKKADIIQVELLEKKLEEMENRSKRNCYLEHSRRCRKRLVLLSACNFDLDGTHGPIHRSNAGPPHKYQTKAKSYKWCNST